MRGDVDRVTPEVVAELQMADDPGHHRAAAVDADAQVEG
jgi:hypothetical protein